MRFIDRPIAKTIEDASHLIKIINDALYKNEGITWAITIKNESKLIGTIGFWRILKEHHRAEIGYLLGPAYQGKGIMYEAVSEILNYGFNTMKLHSVEANVNPDNSSSIKLLERTRFTREAYFKENFFYEGRFLDTVIYSLLAPGDLKNQA